MWWNRLNIVIPLLTIFLVKCASGNYLFRFFDIFELYPNRLSEVPDTESVPGPNGTQAIQFNDKSGNITYTGDTFAYLAHMITTSTDFTFATYFKITQEYTQEKRNWVFFTLSSKSEKEEDDKKTYFHVGLRFSQKSVGVEDQIDLVKETELYVGQYVKRDNRLHEHYLSLGKDSIPLQKWMSLQVRFLGANFHVRLNCKDFGSVKLYTGQTEVFPYNGILSLGFDYKSSILQSGKKPGNFFVGALAEPIIINGNDAFEFFSPCDADFSVQEIPSEPYPSEYDAEKFDEFLKITANAPTVQIQCIESRAGDGPFYAGTYKQDTSNECYQYYCNKGVSERLYQCTSCTDDGKKYEHKETWLHGCLNKTCDGVSYETGEIDSKTITCQNPLNCNKYGSMGNEKPATQCCDKCWSDTCTEGKEYYEGCDRKCSYGSAFVCPSKKKGCWCPEGYALNDELKCIPISDCICKVGDKTYLPGQTVVRSICETCTCFAGSMICYAVCFV